MYIYIYVYISPNPTGKCWRQQASRGWRGGLPRRRRALIRPRPPVLLTISPARSISLTFLVSIEHVINQDIINFGWNFRVLLRDSLEN